jgi:hypothetical protein
LLMDDRTRPRGKAYKRVMLGYTDADFGFPPAVQNVSFADSVAG